MGGLNALCLKIKSDLVEQRTRSGGERERLWHVLQAREALRLMDST